MPKTYIISKLINKEISLKCVFTNLSCSCQLENWEIGKQFQFGNGEYVCENFCNHAEIGEKNVKIGSLLFLVELQVVKTPILKHIHLVHEGPNQNNLII